MEWNAFSGKIFPVICLWLGLILPSTIQGQNFDRAFFFYDLTQSHSAIQAENVIWTSEGLTQFRRNLQGIFISQPIQLSMQRYAPFITAAAVLNVVNLDTSLLDIHIRFSSDANAWTEWQVFKSFHDKKPEDTRFISDQIFTHKSVRYFQYSIVMKQAEPSSLPFWVRNIRFDFFCPGSVNAIYPGYSGLKNTLFGAGECECPLPEYADRTQWDCPDGLDPSCANPIYFPVSHLIVHHSAGINSSTNWAAVVLSIWNLHVQTNGWCDIGYNWLIDPNGVIYEGRGGGNNVKGAHFCGANSGTMGVCMLGTYSNTPPTAAAINSLKELLSWKTCEADLNPLTSAYHASSNKNIPVISGHRDGCSTACPGDSLFEVLPSIRSDVQDIVDECEAVVSIFDLHTLHPDSFQLYPNPARQNVFLKWNGSQGIRGTFSLLTATGQQVWVQNLELHPGQERISIPTDNLSPGLYQVSILSDKARWAQKLSISAQ